MSGKKRKSSSEEKEESSSSNKTSTTKKKPRQPTKHQRRQQRKEATKRKTNTGLKSVKKYDDGEEFFAVESVIGSRVFKGKKQYLIRWVNTGPEEDTWEWGSSLCDTAYKDALMFDRKQKKEREDEAKRLEAIKEAKNKNETATSQSSPVAPGGTAEAISSVKAETTSIGTAVALQSVVMEVEDANGNPLPQPQLQPATSQSQTEDRMIDRKNINYLEVERIYVHAPAAPGRVKELRLNGVPFVLTGHRGWTNFAMTWLDGLDEDEERSTNPQLNLENPRLSLNVDKLLDDIGQEHVPILERNYDDRKPVTQTFSVETFVNKLDGPNGSHFYLHQWQFSNEDRASAQMCVGKRKSVPLPNDIVQEDLAEIVYEGISPYQYLFWGGRESMSRLHNDPGGLDITIAPIIGEKECIMVHREDEHYLYGSKANLEHPDFDKFPMAALARVYKVTVKPGEILYMPYDTFHQCRNVTQCLSYSRMHLDLINLRGFVDSLFKADATEDGLRIPHDKLIWNLATDMIGDVLVFVQEVQDKVKKAPHGKVIEEKVPEHVDTALKILVGVRPVCQEILNRLHEHYKKALNRAKLPSNCILLEENGKGAIKQWKAIVEDIDEIFHEFKHRHSTKKLPKMTKKSQRSFEDGENLPGNTSPTGPELSDNLRALGSSFSGSQSKKPAKSLEDCFNLLEDLQRFQSETVVSDSVILKEEDEILVKWADKSCIGKIIKIEEEMRAYDIRFDDKPDCYRGFIPANQVTFTDERDGDGREQVTTQITVGKKREKADGVIMGAKRATFYQVELNVGGILFRRKWFSRESIIQTNESMESSSELES